MRIQPKRHWDRQRNPAVGECSLCGGEIYPGAVFLRFCGLTICTCCEAPWRAWAAFHYLRGEGRG